MDSLSDLRLKKNISEFKGNATDLIDSIHIVEYEWKTEDEVKKFLTETKKENSKLLKSSKHNERGKKIGVIAQSIKDIVPECVWGSDDEVFGVNWIGIMPILIKSIQERKISDSDPITHFKMADINHTLIQNVGRYTHEHIDSSLDKFNTEFSNLDQQLLDIQSTIANFKSSSDKQFTDIKTQFSQQREESISLVGLITENTANIKTQFNSSVDQLRININTTTEDVASCKNKLDGVNTQIDSIKNKADLTNESLEMVNTKFNQLIESVKTQTDNLNLTNETVNHLSEDIKSTNEDIVTLVKSVKSDFAQQSSDVQHIETELGSLSTNFLKLNELQSSQDSFVHDICSQYDEHFSKLTSQVSLVNSSDKDINIGHADGNTTIRGDLHLKDVELFPGASGGPALQIDLQSGKVFYSGISDERLKKKIKDSLETINIIKRLEVKIET